METIEIPQTWMRAIDRKRSNQTRAWRFQTATGCEYRVRSKSQAGLHHVIPVSPEGKIGPCDCYWFQQHGRQNPCEHWGAVLAAEAKRRGMKLALTPPLLQVVKTESTELLSDYRGRNQIFREEAS